jgi:hypothetical protein
MPGVKLPDDRRGPRGIAFDGWSQRGQNAPIMDQNDVDRIARMALKELGVSAPERIAVTPEGQAGHWRIAYEGDHGPTHLTIKCGQGTTAQWVREQVFAQYLAQN